jgi:hypothetical protein
MPPASSAALIAHTTSAAAPMAGMKRRDLPTCADFRARIALEARFETFAREVRVAGRAVFFARVDLLERIVILLRLSG